MDDPTAASASVTVVLCTAPVDRAEWLAERLLEDGWIACANLVGPVVSRYVWEGRVERAEETLMVLKTRSDLVAELRERLVDLHPYEVPEILELPAAGGLDAYLAWVHASCRSSAD
ncbi:MAG: divalent-cation tolerance protein CutA [Planctomycetota bacterium]|nr:divalent-cation tolerance protein CutA [Planctomycetota bacterium]MDA1222355.1 divalent-cation tolerance protein CutA [Planctomycetota bacterium]